MVLTEEVAEDKTFDSFLREKEEQISKMKFVYLEVPHDLQSKYSDSPLISFSERLKEFEVKEPHCSSGMRGCFHKGNKVLFGVTCAIIITVCVIGLSHM